MGDFDIDDENEDGNITINGVPYCAMITDLIFEKSEEELLSMSLTKPYEKYFAIQKECYTPYFTECCLLDDYNDLTEGQHLFRHMERNHPKKLHSWSSGDIVSIFTTSGSLSGLRFLLFFIVFFLSLFEIFICKHSMQKKYHVGKLLFSYISLHTSPCPASAFAVHLQSLL